MTTDVNGDRLYAWLYDGRHVGWSGELAFYREVARDAGAARTGILDVACGTGRISLALAADGFPVIGSDLSPGMIEVARSKTPGANPSWLVSDMRGLDLGRRFGCVLVGGHSFQFMVTPDDAVTALGTMGGHLTDDGRLVLHIDNPEPGWVDGLPPEPGPFEPSPQVLIHPRTGARWRMASTWSFDRSKRDPVLTWRLERLGPGDRVEEEVNEEPMRMHVFERDELEAEVVRAGLVVEALYGDFDRSPFEPTSPSMIWLARLRRPA